MKKIFLVPVALMTAFLGLVLASCTKSEDLSVVSFRATETSYSVGDTVEFTLTLNNPNNYDITTAVINGASYTVSANGISTRTYQISSSDLIYTTEIYKFTLSKIVYEKDGSIEELEVKNQSVVVSENVTIGNDVIVDSVKLTSLTNEGSEYIYQNDSVKADIKLTKANNVKILYFYFDLIDENENIERVKKAYNDDGKSDNYSITFEMPKMTGKTKVQLSDIDYVKGTAKKEVTSTYSTSCTVMIQPLSLLNVSVSRSSGFATDVNEQKYFDSSSNIDITIKLDNPSDVDVTGISVCGQQFNLSSKEISKNTLFNTITITKTINLSQISKFPEKLTLDKISYKDGSKPLNMNADLTEDIYYYDKVIRTANDLNDMTIKDGVITGRYILANDLVLDNTAPSFFRNNSFDGTLEGNGHSIIIGSTTRSLFATLGTNAVIQNVSLQIGSTNSAFLCQTNSGTLRNIIVGGTLELSKDGTGSVLCDKNSGSITNVEFVTNLVGNSSTFSLVKTNTGTISNVIVNPQEISLSSNTFSALPMENTGEVSNVVLALKIWYNGVSKDDVIIQNKLVVVKTSGGTYKNIILNQNFRNKADTFNKLIEGPNKPSTGSIISTVTDAIGNLDSWLSGIMHSIGSIEYFNYEYNLNAVEEKTISTLIADIGFTSTYYSQLGFRSYNDSNNVFWKTSGTSIGLNFNSK